MGILRQPGVSRPVGGGWGGDAVCGRGAGGGSRRGGITSDTAGSRNAWLRCGVGRQRSGNRSAACNLGARQRHAEAERQRRKRPRGCPAAEARKPVANSGAWSRSRRHPEIFCDRPGCYESPRDSPRAAAAYCGDDCRGAMHQARDRERKWLRRKTEAGRFKRRLEYQAARTKRRQDRVTSDGMTAEWTSTQPDTKAGHSRGSVLFYRRDDDGALDSRAPREVIAHDSQRTPDSRPRPPPAS